MGEFIMDDEEERVKKCYVETITNLLKTCNDIGLLDLVIKLLQRSKVTA
jgi:hypothetical protein